MSSKKLIAWLENFITMGGRSDSGQENLDYFANSNRYQIAFMTLMFTLKIVLKYQIKSLKSEIQEIIIQIVQLKHQNI